MTAIVFLGPTISADHAAKYLDATFKPPVSQGDIMACLGDAPSAIGIIDGYFQNIPSVWHKEILWAMSRGVHVFGSASMGALRAAELSSFGMIGVGKVFESYFKGETNRDDEVAIVHAPQEMNFTPLSEPLANIRPTLAKAVHEKVIDGDLHDKLIAIAEEIYFPERTYANLLTLAGDIPDNERALIALKNWLPANRIDQKQLDAIEMLQAMNAFLGEPKVQKTVEYHVENTFVFDGTDRET